MPPPGGSTDDGIGGYVRVPEALPGIPLNNATAIEEGEPLPSIGSREGRAIVRRWLACGAPVVEATTPLGDPGHSCVNAAPLECFVRFPPGDPPEPNWTSIYQALILPACGIRCHAPGLETQVNRSQLHLENQDRAYEDLLGADGLGRLAAGTDGPNGEPGCGTSGAYLVVPGDPDASLLMEKLAVEEPSCGGPMPPSGLIPAEFLAPVRQWIVLGAPND
jgi:hypothetical protein